MRGGGRYLRTASSVCKPETYAAASTKLQQNFKMEGADDVFHLWLAEEWREQCRQALHSGIVSMINISVQRDSRLAVAE